MLPEIGKLIILKGNHPYSGKTAVVKEHKFRILSGTMGALIQLNEFKHECFVFDESDWEYKYVR